MTPSKETLLPVTQKDREAYLSLNMLPPEDAEAVRAGKWDSLTGMQVLARHRLDHTAPAEPVLRWEGEVLMLGEEEIGCAFETPIVHCWQVDLGADRHGAEPTLTEARAAAEQSVRDWLARAGLAAHPSASPSAEVVEALQAAHDALLSAKAFIFQKHGTQNPARNEAIELVSAALAKVQP